MTFDIKLHTAYSSTGYNDLVQTEVNIIHVVLISHKFLIGGYCHSFKITNTKLWESNVVQSSLEVIHRARLLYLKL